MQLSLRVKSPDGTVKTHSFEASDDKFKVLIAELKAAKTLLDSVQ